MGVKLTPIIQKKQISFDQLKNKKIMIDAYQMLYQFLTSIRQPDGTPLMDSEKNTTSHLVGISSRITNLIEKGILISVCFDGKSPVLKTKTIEEREFRKQQAEKKLEKAREEEDTELMYRYSKQTVRLTDKMIEESKNLLEALGLPIIQAPAEADVQISYCCKKGDIWSAASSDQDCLLFGTPRLLTNLTLSQRKRLPSGATVKTTPELIDLNENLRGLKINQEQLIIIGILVGTDYNIEGIKGIGAKKALKLVKENKDYDKLFKDLNADFNWKEIYDIFTKMPVIKDYKLIWNNPDKEKIKRILVDKHDFNEERVEKTLSKLTNISKIKEQSGLDKWF
mgnify:CR=1 FL=1